MNQNFSKIATIAVVLSLIGGAAFGAPIQKAKKAAMHKTAAVACPVCKMPLSSKKTKENTVAVRLKKGGPVMYCCSGCKMPDSVLVKSAKKPKMSKKKA